MGPLGKKLSSEKPKPLPLLKKKKQPKEDLFEEEEDQDHSPLPNKKGKSEDDTVATSAEPDEVVRLSFSINRTLHRRLKMEAVRQGVPLYTVIEELIKQHIH